MKLPVYLLLPYVLSSSTVDTMGLYFHRLFTQNLEICCLADISGFASIHMASSVFTDYSTETLHKYGLLSWAHTQRFQSISCRRDHGVDNTTWKDHQAFGLLYSFSYQVTSTPTQAQNWLSFWALANWKIVVVACVSFMLTCAAWLKGGLTVFFFFAWFC